MSQKKSICVIACGVLTIEVQNVAKRLGIEADRRFLEAGLHEKPSDLRRQLQEAIDEASLSGKYDQIAVGYGLCGRGTLGIESRGVPLAIPKVHDCIALFDRATPSAPSARAFTKSMGTRKPPVIIRVTRPLAPCSSR